MKSRESLVMVGNQNIDNSDPFGAAPFDPNKLRKHLIKQESLKKIQLKQIEMTEQHVPYESNTTVIPVNSGTVINPGNHCSKRNNHDLIWF